MVHSTTTPQHIAILGAGVLGLTAGIALLESTEGAQRRVTIVSRDIPQPSSSSRQAWSILNPTGSVHGNGGAASRHPASFASAWAGGHHVSDAKTPQEKRHDQHTFRRMCQLEKERPWRHSRDDFEAEPFVWVHQTELFEAVKADGSHPAVGVLDWYPDFKILPEASLPPGIAAGCTFSTLDINVPVYHRWLLSRFLELGGRVIQHEVSSIKEATRQASSRSSRSSSPVVSSAESPSQDFGPVDVMVISPGLGARTLEEVKDEAVHPHRGQVVLVKAPWLKTPSQPGESSARPELPGYSIVRKQGGRETYTIPRGDGTVVCGGTRIVDDWDDTVRPETTQAILQRCLRLCPQLARPDKVLPHLVAPKVEDVEVLGVNVGLRPARRGGIRLERGEDIDGVKIVHSYGYGGWGYQASWGAAYEVKELVDEALGTLKSSGHRTSRL